METKGKPPRLRLLRRLREIFLTTQPPLLAVMQGGDYVCLDPSSHLGRPPLQCACDRTPYGLIADPLNVPVLNSTVKSELWVFIPTPAALPAPYQLVNALV